MIPLRVLSILFMIFAAALVTPSAVASVSGVDERPIPADAIAYWSFDPTRLGFDAGDPGLALVQQGLLRLLQNVITLEAQGASPAAAVLSPKVLGAHPHRVILLDIDLQLAEGAAPGGPSNLTNVAAVVEVHGDLDTAEQTVVDAANDAARRQELELIDGDSTLAHGGDARSLQIKEADDRFQILITRRAETLLIGIGPRSLERYFAAAGGTPRFEVHRQAINAAGEPALEAYVDLDRLRDLIPDEIGWGRTPNLLHAWRIANARDVMVAIAPAANEARPVGLMDIAVSWSSRAEPPQQVHAARLTLSEWPQSIGSPAAGAGNTAVLQAAWLNWLTAGIRTYAALAPEDQAFGNRATQWLRRSLPALERVIAQTQYYAVFQGPGRETAGIALRVPFKRRAPIDRIQGDLQQVFGGLAPVVAYSPQERFWTVSAGDSAKFYLGIRDEELVGSWDKAALRPNPRP